METPAPFVVKCDRWDQCKERDEERLKAIDKLWTKVSELEEARVEDLKESTAAMHKLALAVEGATGKMTGIVLALGGVMTVISLVFQMVFRK